MDRVEPRLSALALVRGECCSVESLSQTAGTVILNTRSVVKNLPMAITAETGHLIGRSFESPTARSG